MRALLWIMLAATLVAAPARADEAPSDGESVVNVTRTARGLSLEARDASLREVLQRIAALESIDLDIRGTSDPRVTATIHDASLAETLQRLLRYDFVLGVDRLIVYLRDGGQTPRAGDGFERSQVRRGGFRVPPRRPPPGQHEPEPEPEPESDTDDDE